MCVKYVEIQLRQLQRLQLLEPQAMMVPLMMCNLVKAIRIQHFWVLVFN